MVSPSARRRAVKMIVEEGIGKVAVGCRALGLSRSSYYRSGRSSLESRRIRKEVLELKREASSLRLSADYRTCLESWRFEDTDARPHSSLGYRTPSVVCR